MDPLHPDYRVQLPVDFSNLSGVTFEQVQKSAPEYDFTFSGKLIGYFDHYNPAIGVVWTTKSVYVDITEEPAAQLWPSSPPDNGKPLVIIPPPTGCTTNCGTVIIPPPGSEEPPVVTPEPGTTVFLGLGILSIIVGIKRKYLL